LQNRGAFVYLFICLFVYSLSFQKMIFAPKTPIQKSFFLMREIGNFNQFSELPRKII